MKILRATPTFFPHVTGPAYQAFRISMGLEKRGHNSPVITTNYEPAEDQRGFPPEMGSNRDFPFKVIRKNTTFKFHQYRLPFSASLTFTRADFDVVHCHGYHNAIKDIFYLLNFVKRKPFIIHGHGSFSKHKDPTIDDDLHFRLYDLIWKRTVKNADAVIVSTEEERKDAIRFGVDDDCLHVVPVGKDPDVYTSIPRDPPTEVFRVLFVGRLAPRRNVEMVLRALQIVKEEYPDINIEVQIVGGEDSLSEASRGSYLSELRSKCHEFGVEQLVTFCGPKYDKELVKKYRKSHIFVNPSHFENFGQASLEAAFAGLPLITTNTGVAPELVDQSDGGFIIEDADELADKIVETATNRSLCKEMGRRVQQSARQDYTWESIINRYMRIYKSLI